MGVVSGKVNDNSITFQSCTKAMMMIHSLSTGIPMRLVIVVDVIYVFIWGTNETELTGIYSIIGCNGHNLFG